jgi:hypothetical protein
MRRTLLSAVLLTALAVAAPVRASVLVELSFAAKMEASDVVIVGTVTSAAPGHPDQYDATVTVTTLATLKGEPQAQHVVFAQSRIAEDQMQCCEIGATYVMFLRHARNDPRLVSVDGRYGIVRIGPAHNEPPLEVVDPARQ